MLARTHSHRVVSLVAAGLALAAQVRAQTVLYTVHGEADGEQLGESVAAAGDVDADGVPDFVAGAHRADGRLGDSQGLVRVFSGATGEQLFVMHGESDFAQCGFRVKTAGDVDLDGHADLLVGQPTYRNAAGDHVGRVSVISGATTVALLVLEGTQFDQLSGDVASAGDVDGDGRPDFLAGDSGGCIGEVTLHSGADGNPLEHWTWYGVCPYDYLGAAIDTGADVDGDGVDDYLVGAPGADENGSSSGSVRVYSGRDGSTLYTRSGASSSWSLGYDVAFLGDTDRDGYAEFATGSLELGPGRVRVYSGADGSIRFQVQGETSYGYLGESLSAVGDVDGDGACDLAAGVRPGEVWILSGRDGSRIDTLRGFEAPYRIAVGSIGDVDGDGRPELLVGASGGSGNRGAVHVISLWRDCNENGIHDSVDLAGGASADVNETGIPDECELVPFCTALPNSSGAPAAIWATGTTSVSVENLVLHAAPLPPGQNGLFVYSPDEASMPLGDGILCLGSATQGFVNRLPFEVSSAAGEMTHVLDLPSPPYPATPIVPGSTWRFQCWFRDAPAGGAGFNFSSGLEIRFYP